LKGDIEYSIAQLVPFHELPMAGSMGIISAKAPHKNLKLN
jgi:hypothetical protein